MRFGDRLSGDMAFVRSSCTNIGMDFSVRDGAPVAFPAARAGWLLVAFLLAAYAVSFVDRQILSLLVEDLRRDLSIGDWQIGLLQGPAFGIFYAVMGMPFGWLADRVHRVRLIAAGLLVWTLMTLLGGYCTTFEALFLTRVGVGVGEAALVPAAVSLLSDSFAPHRRAMPLATFTAGVSVGAGLSLMLSGALIAFARQGVAQAPLIGAWLAGKSSWQIVLVLAGLAGIPLALAILTLKEPKRRAATAPIETPDESGLFPYLKANRRLFAPLLAGSSLLYLFSNAFSAWMPTLFVRGFGWEPSAVGLRLGALILGAALAGNIASGAIATGLLQRGHISGALLTMIGGGALLTPFAILGPLAPSAPLAQAAVVLIYIAIALCFGVATATFVAVTPAALRGRMVALYLLLGNLVGLGLGPPSVGLILEHGVGDTRRVGAALALIAAATVLLGTVLLRAALRPHAARAAHMVE